MVIRKDVEGMEPGSFGSRWSCTKSQCTGYR